MYISQYNVYKTFFRGMYPGVGASNVFSYCSMFLLGVFVGFFVLFLGFFGFFCLLVHKLYQIRDFFSI